MKSFITVLVILLCSQVAFASYPKPFRLPQSTRIEADGEKFEAFSLEGYKLLLKMDYDLWFLTERQDQFIFLQKKDTTIIEALRQQLVSKDRQIDILQGERLRLTEKWKDENQKRHICENKPKLGSWLAWSAAGVATVAAAVFGVILLAK